MMKLDGSNREGNGMGSMNKAPLARRELSFEGSGHGGGQALRLWADRGLKSLLALSMIATSLPVQAMTTGPGSQAQIVRELQLSAATSGAEGDDSSNPLLASADDYFREAEVELDEQGRQSAEFLRAGPIKMPTSSMPRCVSFYFKKATSISARMSPQWRPCRASRKPS